MDRIHLRIESAKHANDLAYASGLFDRPGRIALVGAIFALSYPVTAERAAKTRRLLTERHEAALRVVQAPDGVPTLIHVEEPLLEQ